MKVQVEFYGTARIRSGKESVVVEVHDNAKISDVLNRLGEVTPQFISEYVKDGQIDRRLMVNINGDRFVSELETLLEPDCTLLILPRDAGG